MQWLMRFLLAVVLLISGTPIAAQDQVTPSSRVRTNVVVRSGPERDAPPVAALDPGERLTLVGERAFWYEVRLPDGRTGFVSKAWTLLVGSLAREEFRLHVIDVGTGLALFVEGPGFTLLYDAGSNDDTRTGSRNRALAYLRRVRPDLATIDHVVLSHAHRDHVGLLPDLFDAYRIGHVWDTGRLYDSCGYRRFLLRIAAEPDVVFHTAVGENETRSYRFAECNTHPRTINVPLGPRLAPSQVALGQGASMAILHVDTELHEDPNENSLVVRLDLADRRVLLMGDAEGGARRDPSAPPDPGSVEEQLLACCRAALAADILVAGHHGSSTSSRSSFLDAVDAEHYVISSGPKRYSGTSLPDPSVVAELDRRGELWRTDLDDTACATDLDKIGPDGDGRAGGCDNILFRITAGRPIEARYQQLAD